MEPGSTPDPPQIAIMKVEIGTPLGPIRGEVGVDTGPMRLADLVATATGLTDIMVARARRAEENENRRISCCAGCGACCRQMVPLSIPEAYAVADLLDALPEPRRAEVRARFAGIAERVSAEGLSEALLDSDLLADPSRELSFRYFRLGLACPFLVEESCGIHPDRPVACREYNVTSPAANCVDPARFGVRLVPMPLPLSLPLARLTAKLTGEKPALVPLSLVPSWVARNVELGRREWPGLELFRDFLEILNEAPTDWIER